MTFVTLVTGGASGLGRATALYIASNKEGSRVVIFDLPTQSEEASKIVKQIGTKSAIFVAGDVTREEDVKAALKKTKAKFGRLDAVVNFAGIFIPCATYDFAAQTPHPMDVFTRILTVNTMGTFNVTRLAVALMAENEAGGTDGQRGVVVNVASVAAQDGIQASVAYSASKAAVAGMTLPLAREFAQKGIRCVCIAPGFCDTPILKGIEPLAEMMVDATPFPKRLGRPEEIGRLVQHILENSFLNGEVIRIDGAIRMPDLVLPSQ